MSMDFTDPSNLSPAALETGETLAPRFDAQGLITAVAVEAGSNDILMLAHMNADALRLTLETGFATYYSRSRKALWKKGETSGEQQRVVEVRIDCDQDAVIVIVEQLGRGAACHTGRKSCFFRKIAQKDGKPELVAVGGAPLFDPETVYRTD